MVLKQRQWAIVQAALLYMNVTLHGGSDSDVWDGDDGPEPTSEEIDKVVEALSGFIEAKKCDDWHMRLDPLRKHLITIEPISDRAKRAMREPAFHALFSAVHASHTTIREDGYGLSYSLLAQFADAAFHMLRRQKHTVQVTEDVQALLDKADNTDMPWCSPCGSYHMVPKDLTHHAILKCRAEPPAKPEERTLFQVSVGFEGDTHRRFSPHSSAARNYFSVVPTHLGGWGRQGTDLIVPNEDAPSFIARLREEFIVKVDEREPEFHVRMQDEDGYCRFVPCTQQARQTFNAKRPHTGEGWLMHGDSILIPSNRLGDVRAFIAELRDGGFVIKVEGVEPTPEPQAVTRSGVGRFEGAVAGFVFKSLVIGDPSPTLLSNQLEVRLTDVCMPYELYRATFDAKTLPHIAATYAGKEYVLRSPRVVGVGVAVYAQDMIVTTELLLVAAVETEEPPLSQHELRKLRKMLIGIKEKS